MTTPLQSLVRRSVIVLGTATAVAVTGLVTAGPAGADVPEGWSNPDDVSALHALLILGGIPVLLFVLITLAVYVPALVRGERVTPGAPAVEEQWFGGPRKGTAELAGPDTEESKAGGASGRW
ncbi:hypothetical protein ACT8ZV_20715 [Nocardioides sp. MAHUQ-72]|uniref:hypothetical protein n=1 Tax=unclassified Nocardioides TaxID=2615069 RepID=UPI00361D8D8B